MIGIPTSDTMSKIHLELLDKERQAVFQSLIAFKDIGYLAGGTALALQINHRRSEDFDIFIDKQIDNKLRLNIEKIFGSVIYTLNTSDQINFITNKNIKITFLWYYFKRISGLTQTNSIPLASIDDIIADKAATIGRRAVWRDYVDIFLLLKTQNYSLEKIIYLGKKKFKGEFVETQFLEQLRYFEDLQIVPIDFVKEKFNDLEIKSYLQEQVKNYLKKIWDVSGED